MPGCTKVCDAETRPMVANIELKFVLPEKIVPPLSVVALKLGAINPPVMVPPERFNFVFNDPLKLSISEIECVCAVFKIVLN